VKILNLTKKRGYHLVGEREKAIIDGLFPLGMIIIFISSISGMNLAAKDKLFLKSVQYFEKRIAHVLVRNFGLEGRFGIQHQINIGSCRP
jgi:hypothetical protein